MASMIGKTNAPTIPMHQNTVDLPPTLYRVQHNKSYTYYDTASGFQARASYYMNYCHWLNKRKIEKHLDWADRSFESTPFISMFDNQDDANKRVELHSQQGRQDIFVASISTQRLQQQTLAIQFSDGVINLPVWTDGETTVLAMKDAAQCFHLNFTVVQKSEWLAVESIPQDRIEQITTYQ